MGGRVLVVADLHLAPDPTPAQLAGSNELAAAIEASTGPGAVIVAGNLLAAGAAGPAPDAVRHEVDTPTVLFGHARLAAALEGYAAGRGRRVVILPGDRDAQLAWSEPCQEAIRGQLGAEPAMAVDLHIATGAGVRNVRVEPGHNLDALARFGDARNPGESPFAQHIRDELLPTVRRRQTGSATWLSGMEQLDDPAALSRFIASRLVYRRLIHTGWLLLIPVVMALVLRIPSLAVRSARHGEFGTRIGLFVLAVALEVVLLVGLGIVALRRTNQALSAIALDEEGRDPNEAPRAEARSLITAGHTGLITAHTCRPELVHLGQGFYANAGAAAEVVSEYPSRLPGIGLPPVFMGHRLLSWIELDAGSDLHVRLLHGRRDLPGSTLLERIVARRPDPSTSTPTRSSRAAAAAGPAQGIQRELRASVVASFPQGDTWPPSPSKELHDRLVRRLAAAVVVVVGFLSLVSAMSDPLRDRLDVLRQLFPLYVPETAAALAAFGGVGLIVVARGIRRGQRRAWLVCQAFLLTVGVLHLIKGVDVEETVIVAVVAAFLWIQRSSFEARTDVMEMGRGVGLVLVAALLTIAAGTVAVELSSAIQHDHISWPHAFEAALERMVGLTGVTVPHRVNSFLAPTMLTATLGLVLAFLAVIFRPVAARRRLLATRASSTSDAMARARAIVARHGSGTLDYFALRPDKEFFFFGDTVVAYAVYGGVCLVSPDPIGPMAEREEGWGAFRRFVDEHGWALGGLGAGEDWLPIYRSTGMHDLYVGDEGVVRIARFTLEGGRFKGLRQAVNRIAKYGYTISFHDPSTLDARLRESLTEVMTKSRRGDVERGFSMTLGRVFDPEDAGLLLAVVHGPDGSPVAFCQYVPAPGIGGYSLDLMRRDDGEHPNGLIDFAVVETIKELKNRRCEGLGLNFATMRAVLAGEAGEGVSHRVQAWLLRRMGDSMQIESLWKFNAKFDPDWQPRYAIYDAPENMLAVAIAVARAESFWELPLIGRFLVPAAARA